MIAAIAIDAQVVSAARLQLLNRLGRIVLGDVFVEASVLEFDPSEATPWIDLVRLFVHSVLVELKR